jgi:predicted negative regulator of RcsB-dependent stress response
VKAVTGTQNVAAPPAAKAPPDPGNWLPNWRHVTISFVAGALVATLINLQWREWQRRQQAAATAERYQQPPAAVKHQPSDGSFHSQG